MKYIVRIYFKTNAEHEFPARDLRNARDIAATRRIVEREDRRGFGIENMEMSRMRTGGEDWTGLAGRPWRAGL